MTTDLDARLTGIEQTQTTILRRLEELTALRVVKDFYSVDEVAERVDRTPYQVREWLRMGRMEGIRRSTGRGRHKEWKVSQAELERHLNHGLRPLSSARN